MTNSFYLDDYILTVEDDHLNYLNCLLERPTHGSALLCDDDGYCIKHCTQSCGRKRSKEKRHAVRLGASGSDGGLYQPTC